MHELVRSRLKPWFWGSYGPEDTLRCDSWNLDLTLIFSSFEENVEKGLTFSWTKAVSGISDHIEISDAHEK